MISGLCIASAECAGDLSTVSFTSVEGDGFTGCLARVTTCVDGLCS
jgi:hypothetical protein